MARRPRLRHSAGYKAKRVGLSAEVYRHVSNAGKPVFQACVGLARGKRGAFGLARTSSTCAEGRNPRVAIGAAMKAAGAKLAGRRGSFASYR